MKKPFVLTMATVTLFVCATICMAAQTTYRCDSMSDAYVDELSPDVNYGGSTSIKLVADPTTPPEGGDTRGLIRFNIPTFISAAQIQSATIHLYGERSSILNVEFYALNPSVGLSWFEKVVTDPKKTFEGVTWNELGGEVDSLEWIAPGGDYDTSVSDSGKIGAGWNVIGIKNLVAGNLDKVRRYGILIKLQDESGDVFSRVSARETTTGNQPYLTLVVNQELAATDYTCPVTEDTYIDEGFATSNFNHKTRIMLASNTVNHYGLGRGLWKFEIPCNLSSDIIGSATLYISGSIHAAADGVDVYCYALNVPFDEETATWDTLTGGDFDTGAVAAGTLPVGGDWETAIDMSALLSGNLDKVRDNGIIMVLQNEYVVPDVHQHIASKEFFDAEDFAAYLEITALTTDTDGDGVADHLDNCPDVANEEQEDILPSGGNGIGDACECHANTNADNKVDLSDLIEMKKEFNRTDCPSCTVR